MTDSLGKEERWVAATESARSVPLGVFAHLVGTTTSRDPVALLSAARDALAARDDAVVGVDDAHLLDNLSATLLHQIAMDRAAGRLHRSQRRAGPRRGHLVVEDAYLQRMELGSFTKTESVGLIETELGGEIEEFSADVMWQSSGGNCLYLQVTSSRAGWMLAPDSGQRHLAVARRRRPDRGIVDTSRGAPTTGSVRASAQRVQFSRCANHSRSKSCASWPETRPSRRRKSGD